MPSTAITVVALSIVASLCAASCVSTSADYYGASPDSPVVRDLEHSTGTRLGDVPSLRLGLSAWFEHWGEEQSGLLGVDLDQAWLKDGARLFRLTAGIGHVLGDGHGMRKLSCGLAGGVYALQIHGTADAIGPGGHVFVRYEDETPDYGQWRAEMRYRLLTLGTDFGSLDASGFVLSVGFVWIPAPGM